MYIYEKILVQMMRIPCFSTIRCRFIVARNFIIFVYGEHCEFRYRLPGVGWLSHCCAGLLAVVEGGVELSCCPDHGYGLLQAAQLVKVPGGGLGRDRGVTQLGGVQLADQPGLPTPPPGGWPGLAGRYLLLVQQGDREERCPPAVLLQLLPVHQTGAGAGLGGRPCPADTPPLLPVQQRGRAGRRPPALLHRPGCPRTALHNALNSTVHI